MSKRAYVLVCLVSLVLLVLGVQAGSLEPPGPPAPTMKTLSEIEPRTPIRASDIPFTIDAPGSYYLIESATGVSGQDGIMIDAEDVTLDLNGYALTGVAGSGSGIWITQNGIRATILDGIVRNWDNRGIGQSDFAESVTVRNVTAQGNGSHGIHVRNGGAVRDCAAHGNGSITNSDGIAAEDRSMVIGCVARGNARFGINVTNESLVTQCNATGNPGGDINLGVGCTGNGNR